MSDGGVRNVYNIKIINKTHQDKSFTILINRPNFAELKISNHDEKNIVVPAQTIVDLRTFVTISADKINNLIENQAIVQINIVDNSTKKIEKVSSIFIKKDNDNF